MWDKASIQEKIRTDLNWVIRAIEVLYERQTADEQADGCTNHLNGVGFNGSDSGILTSFCVQIQKRKRYRNPILLSDKQIAAARKMLPKYWRQILDEINNKVVK